MRQLQHFGNLIHPLIDLGFFRPRQLQAEGHVFCHRQMRIKRIRLEHHADATIGGRHFIHAFIANLQFTGRDVFQACNHAQQSGFTTAGRPDEHHKLAFFYFQVDVAGNHGVAKGFVHAVKGNARHPELLYLLPARKLNATKSEGLAGNRNHP
ncbi:hypothetical protein SRABI106_02637 [Rahnella aquatilis]|nr:hypothetical protein SRABI106_02637 [Rahnella aquatilis]